MITQYAVSFNQKEQTMKTIPQILSAELNQPEAYIQNVIALLDEGNTIPAVTKSNPRSSRRAS